jgi:zinc transporter 9
MVIILFIMSAVLGVSTFAIGMLPLSYAFSSWSSSPVTNEQYAYYTEIESHLERLSALGTGILLGAALGVIIPEYVQPRVSSLMHLFTQCRWN